MKMRLSGFNASILLVVAALAFCAGSGESLAATATQLEQSPISPSLELSKVLIVSSNVEVGDAPGIKQLLEGHQLQVTALTWAEATAERARAFDLVIVAGGAGGRMADVVLDYDRPVLAIGQFGCDYFGELNLKNGAPFT